MTKRENPPASEWSDEKVAELVKAVRHKAAAISMDHYRACHEAHRRLTEWSNMSPGEAFDEGFAAGYAEAENE